MWRSAARSIGACLALLCFFAVSSADPSPPSRADVTSGVRVAQRLIDTIPSPWRLDGDVRMAGDDAPVAQGNFVQASYALNKASLDSLATFSRAGNATQFDSSGYLTYGPNQQLTQSATFTDASWSKLNCTVSGNTVTATSTSVGLVYKAFTPTANVNYILAFEVSAGTAPYIVIDAPDGASDRYAWFRTSDMTVGTVNGALTASVTSLGAGRYRVAVRFNGGAGSATSYAISGASADGVNTQVVGHTYNVYNSSLAAVTYETTPRTQDQVITTSTAYYGPRFDYTYNGSSWVPAGLLAEGAATNLVTNSASLSSFSPYNLTQTANFIASPDGTTSATKIDDGVATSIFHDTVFSPTGLTASTAYTVSVFAKAGTGRYLAVSNVGQATADGGYAVFDLQTGSVTQSASLGSGSLVSAVALSIGGGWYRLSVSAICGTNTGRYFFVNGANAGTYTPGDGNGRQAYNGANNTWYVWGAQLELGSFAASYIPTGASAVTRPTETVQLTGAALAALQGANGSAIIQTVSEGTTAPAAITNLIRGTNSILYRDTTNKAGTTNGTNILLSTSTPTWSSATRTGLAWSASGRSLNYTGGTIATDANIVTNSGTVYLGSNAGSAAENGWYQSMAFYNVRLPDATLTTKLTVNSSYAANDNGIRYAFADNDNLPVHWRVAL